MNKTLNALQAYCTVIDYLDKYYFKTYADDIGDLVGDMVFLQDGKPVDPAAWSDWIRALEKAGQSDKADKNDLISIEEAYAAMTYYLENYAKLTNSKETKKLLDEEILLKNKQPVNKENWDNWISSVEKILAQNPLVLPPFTLRN